MPSIRWLTASDNLLQYRQADNTTTNRLSFEMFTSTAFAVVAVLLVLPVLLLLHATESDHQRQTRQATRLSRRYGLSQRQIAQQLGISQSTVSRRLARA